MFRVVTEEQAILSSQQLDLIYSQPDMLYKVFPNAPRPYINPPKLVLGPHVDGVIGYISDSMSQLGQLIVTSQPPTSAFGFAKAPSLEQSIDVLTVKSTQPKNNQQFGGKKNNKRNKQKNQNDQESRTNP